MIATSIQARVLALALSLLHVLIGGHVDCCAPLHAFEGEHHDSRSDQSVPCHIHGSHENLLHDSEQDCACFNGSESDHEHFCGGTQPVLNVVRVMDNDFLYKLVVSPLFVKVQHVDTYASIFAQSYDDTSVFETDALKVRLNVLYEVFLI